MLKYSYLFLLTNRIKLSESKVGIIEIIISTIISLLILFVCIWWVNYIVNKKD